MRQSLVVQATLRDRYLSSLQLDSFARVLAAKDDDERATRLVAAADRLRRDVGMEVSGVRLADRERAIQALREVVGPDRFAAAWAAGQTLTLEQAVAEARRLGSPTGLSVACETGHRSDLCLTTDLFKKVTVGGMELRRITQERVLLNFSRNQCFPDCFAL